jgi:transposase
MSEPNRTDARRDRVRIPREFAAFLGLTPKQNSSGGKPKLGRVLKMGNRNSRKLLQSSARVIGAKDQRTTSGPADSSLRAKNQRHDRTHDSATPK